MASGEQNAFRYAVTKQLLNPNTRNWVPKVVDIPGGWEMIVVNFIKIYILSFTLYLGGRNDIKLLSFGITLNYVQF